ncbi:hypothetical protein PR048_025248 [Dryococelus australis]|uniref:Uncharacterized protein n=1 Tax=Dryococelus australis TaxID=614101 RepID=A0ABQ9GQU1_9NEOP|nr:hypothetical protein PR048_025248 [Dryococelus australis]
MPEYSKMAKKRSFKASYIKIYASNTYKTTQGSCTEPTHGFSTNIILGSPLNSPLQLDHSSLDTPQTTLNPNNRLARKQVMSVILSGMKQQWLLSGAAANEQTSDARFLGPKRPGGAAPRFPHVEIVLDDASGRRGLSRGSPAPPAFSFRRCTIINLPPPSSALKTSMLRATQISSLTLTRTPNGGNYPYVKPSRKAGFATIRRIRQLPVRQHHTADKSRSYIGKQHRKRVWIVWSAWLVTPRVPVPCNAHQLCGLQAWQGPRPRGHASESDSHLKGPAYLFFTPRMRLRSTGAIRTTMPCTSSAPSPLAARLRNEAQCAHRAPSNIVENYYFFHVAVFQNILRKPIIGIRTELYSRLPTNIMIGSPFRVHRYGRYGENTARQFRDLSWSHNSPTYATRQTDMTPELDGISY